MCAGSSHVRAFDPQGVIWDKQAGLYKDHHTLNHQDCLILPQPSGSTAMIEYKIDSLTYIESKYPNLVPISIPGLRRANLNFSRVNVGPWSPFNKLTINQSLRRFNHAEISILIYGSNDHETHFSKEPEEAVKELLLDIQRIYTRTNFKVVFITTLFPRMEFYENNILKRGLKEFNNELIKASRSRNSDLEIINKNGEKTKLKFRIINTREIFPYEKMFSKSFFCQFKQHDGTHLNAEYSEQLMDLIHATIGNFKKKENRRAKKRKFEEIN